MGAGKRAAAALATVGAAIGGVAYWSSLKRTSKELEVTHKLGISSLSFTGVTIRLDVMLRNPSSNSFKIKYPHIKMMLGEDTIGSSQLIDTSIKVPADGEVHIDKILIAIPLMEELSLIGSLLTPLQNGESVMIKVVCETDITLLGIFTFPYTKIDEIPLKNAPSGS